MRKHTYMCLQFNVMEAFGNAHRIRCDRTCMCDLQTSMCVAFQLDSIEERAWVSLILHTASLSLLSNRLSN